MCSFPLRARTLFNVSVLLMLGACATYERTVSLRPDTGIWMETKGWGPHYYFYECGNYRVETPVIQVRSSVQLELDVSVSGGIAEEKASLEFMAVSVLHNGRLYKPIKRSLGFYLDQNYFSGVYLYDLDVIEVEKFDVIFDGGPRGCSIPNQHYRKVRKQKFSLIHMGI